MRDDLASSADAIVRQAVVALSLLIPISMTSWAMAQVGQPVPAAGPRVRAMLVGIERYEEQLAFPRCRGAGAMPQIWLDG